MKAVFIFPPAWDIISPSTGIPTLMGILSDMGVNCIAHDLNIDFYNSVLNSNYIKEAIKKTTNILETKNPKYSEEDLEYIRKKLNDQIRFTKTDQLDNILNFIKYKKYYNNYKSRSLSRLYIENCLELISLPFYPYKIISNNFINIKAPQSEFEKEDYLKIAENKEDNIFYEYLENKIPALNIQDGDLICISINDLKQLLASLTFSKLIKKKYNVKIQIGGTWADHELIYVKQNKQLFEEYFDYFILGLGDNAIKELWEYHTGKRCIEDVSNLLYLKDGEFCQNKISNHISVKNTKFNYNGYNFKQYFMPETLLPIRVSHGCYWGKCTFCNYNLYREYNPRSVDDVIKEIEELNQKYGIRLFYFQDAALTPKFIEEFADKIISKKLNIRYITNLRLEKNFLDKKLLKKLYKSGLRIAMWGLESACPKIIKNMNKGFDIQDAEKILKYAYNTGIFNHLYLIYHFPSETLDDFNMTIDFLKSNKYIKSFTFHEFIIYKDTYIYKHPEEFNIDPKQLENIDFIMYRDIDNTDLDQKIKIKEEQSIEFFKKTYNKSIYCLNSLPSVLLLLDNTPIQYFKYINIYFEIIDIFNIKKIKKKIKRKINNLKEKMKINI